MEKLAALVLAYGTLLLPGNTINTVFNENSNLPIEFRQSVLDSVISQCENLVSKNGLLEKSTKVIGTAETQYYTTRFNSSYYKNIDEKNKLLTTALIIVNSVKYESSDDIETLSVESTSGCNPKPTTNEKLGISEAK